MYSASGGPRWDSRAGQEPGSPSVELRGSEAGALSFCPRDLVLAGEPDGACGMAPGQGCCVLEIPEDLLRRGHW